MYCNTNYPTKKALKEAIANGNAGGVHRPGPFGDDAPMNGTATVEGPHYPKPHRWCARVTLKDGVIVAAK